MSKSSKKETNDRSCFRPYNQEEYNHFAALMHRWAKEHDNSLADNNLLIEIERTTQEREKTAQENARTALLQLQLELKKLELESKKMDRFQREEIQPDLQTAKPNADACVEESHNLSDFTEQTSDTGLDTPTDSADEMVQKFMNDNRYFRTLYPITKFGTNGEFLGTYKSRNDVGKAIGVTPILRHFDAKTLMSGAYWRPATESECHAAGFKTRDESAVCFVIQQIDITTGEIARTHASLTQAASFLIDNKISKHTPKSLAAMIASCVNGNRSEAAGYKWNKVKS